jgi:RHS repeat-associated protein
MKRGTLTGGPPFTGISGTPAREQDWTLDKTGNWTGFLDKVSGTTDLNQSRTANKVNEITAISASGGTPVWATPAYDATGNSTSFPQLSNPTDSFTATYDAWNRMTSVSGTDGLIADYAYDGLGRRIYSLLQVARPLSSSSSSGDETESRHFFYTASWQDIEEWVVGATNPQVQYVWGLRYIDELVTRDDASSTRLYAMQDANFNLTSICNTSGGVVERYNYLPYGTRTVMNASWSVLSNSAYDWVIGFQGLMHDGESGLIYVRNRYLQPEIGGWMRRDPRKYVDGMNLYQYALNAPAKWTDPYGLDCCGPDVTTWFIKDLANQLSIIQHAYEVVESDTRDLQEEGVLVLASTRKLETFRKYMARLAYKWMDFSAPGTATGKCYATVELAGKCIRKNQLGNIAFAYLANLAPPPGFNGRTAINWAYKHGAHSYRGSHQANFGVWAGTPRADNLAAFAVGTALASGGNITPNSLNAALNGNLMTYSGLDSWMKGWELTWVPEYGGFDTAKCCLTHIPWNGKPSAQISDDLTNEAKQNDPNDTFDDWANFWYENYWGPTVPGGDPRNQSWGKS